jgi:hypothetical protein
MRRRPETSRLLYATKCPLSLDTRYLGATSHSVMLELRSSTISVGLISVALMHSPRNTEEWHFSSSQSGESEISSFGGPAIRNHWHVSSAH